MDEMTTILAKEEDELKKGRARSVAMVSNHNNSHKREPPHKSAKDNKLFKKQNMGNKGSGQGTGLASNASKSEGFKGKCNYCQKFRHKIAYCRL